MAQINEENARRMVQGVGAMRTVMLARAEAVGKQMVQVCESMRPGLAKVGRDALQRDATPQRVEVDAE